MKKHHTTLKKVNAHIQTKYPLIELVKGRGYFYVYSDDNDMGLKLASLYTTSIYVPRITDASYEKWMELIEFILEDLSAHTSQRKSII